MGKDKNATQGGRHSKECLPTPLSCRGEAGDTADVLQDLRDYVDLLEERMSQVGTSLKTPFRFRQSS